MSCRLQLLHAWTRQITSLLPHARVTRCRVLALFVLGMIWADTVRLHRVAAALPLGVRVPSIERRLRRFLANPRVTVEGLWQPLLSPLLAPWAGRELLLVLDLTPHRTDGTVVSLGVVVHRRVLPLSWRVLPQHDPWPVPLGILLRAMLAEVAAALPLACTVTVVADRGLAGPAVLDAVVAQGWHVLLRLPAGDHRVRVGDTPACALTDLLRQVGRRWAGPVQMFAKAGWRPGHLTIYQAVGQAERWLLFSTRPGGAARVREYAKRGRIDATFADGKRRGGGLEQSRVSDAVHLDRLLLVWHLALWWLHGLGRQVIKRGLRPWFERRDQRQRSLIRLGRLWLLHRLDHGRCPPLLFRRTTSGWVARGTP